MEELEADLKARIKLAQELTSKIDREIFHIDQGIEFKRGADWDCHVGLQYLTDQKEQFESCMIYERKKVDLLQQLLHKFRFADNAYQKRPIKTCLSAQEMNKHKLHFRIAHGSKSLAKEKQLLKGIKVSQHSQQEDDEEEDSCGSFLTEFEKQLQIESSLWQRWSWIEMRLYEFKQTWWLDHQMPFIISKGDTVEDREIEIGELYGRIFREGVVLQRQGELYGRRFRDGAVLQRQGDEAFVINKEKAWSCTVKEKAWTSFAVKKVLQEQVKIAVNKIDETRKSKLALGLGSKIRQVEWELVAIKKDTESLGNKLPALIERRHEARKNLSRLRKQHDKLLRKQNASSLEIKTD